jgi:hypothetical protein
LHSAIRSACPARLVATAVYKPHLRWECHVLCSMCIGVGQGIAMLLERGQPDQPLKVGQGSLR